jgi:hypothetical protein
MAVEVSKEFKELLVQELRVYKAFKEDRDYKELLVKQHLREFKVFKEHKVSVELMGREAVDPRTFQI